MCEFARMADPLKANGEQLFLLELLVDQLEVPKEDVPEDKPSIRPVRIKCKFLDFPVIELDQGDFQLTETPAKPDCLPELQEPCEIPCLVDMLEETPKTSLKIGLLPCVDPPIDYSAEKNTSKQCCQEKAKSIAANLPPGTKLTTGKSCLFPMRPDALKSVLKDSPLYFVVYRAGLAMEPHQVVGKTKVSLGAPFAECIDRSQWSRNLPVSAYLEETIPLPNLVGEIKGKMNMLVRLTCYGNSMFTDIKYDVKCGGQKSRPTYQLNPPKDECFGCQSPQCCHLAGLQKPRYSQNNTLSTLRSKQVDDKFKNPVAWRSCVNQNYNSKRSNSQNVAPTYVANKPSEEKKRYMQEQNQYN